MKGFIYKITNRVNNKVYIGQTRFTVEHRFKQHIKNYNIEHRKQILYKAFEKYGLENFSAETLEEVDVERLNEREIYWIAYYNSFKNGYNATLGGSGNLYIWTDSQYEEMRSLYLSGFTLKDIAFRFNVSQETIRGILKSLNVKLRHNPMDMNRVEADSLIQSYTGGLKTLTDIAKEYNTDRQTVKRFLISKGIKIKSYSIILESKQLQKEAIKDFLNGMKYHDMEKKFKADARTIKRILVINGIDLNMYRGLRKTNKGDCCLTDKQCLDIISLYNQNVLVSNIATKYSVDISTIYTILKKYHVKCKRYNHSKSVQPLKDKQGQDVLQ